MENERHIPSSCGKPNKKLSLFLTAFSFLVTACINNSIPPHENNNKRCEEEKEELALRGVEIPKHVEQNCELIKYILKNL